MKIALAQLNYHIGNFEHNVSIIKQAIQKGKVQSADIVVFAELAVCGYPPRDFLEFKDFIAQCNNAVDDIAKECVGIAAIVGSPSINPNADGKRLFNSAFFLCDGKVQQIISKSLLPTYDVFDEYRYFESNKNFKVIHYKDTTIALTICEDLWYVDDNPLYTVCPMDELMKHKPDVMLNIAASPFSYSHAEERKKIFIQNVKKYHLPLFYVNHVGAQTELIFDGGSMVMDKNGNVLDEMKYFAEDLKIYDLGFMIYDFKIPSSIVNQSRENRDFAPLSNQSTLSNLYAALILGIRDYFRKMGLQKAIVGLSGGIDSAVTLVLAEKALGKKNVRAVLMPSQFSSEHSVKDAEELAKNLDVQYDLIPIEKAFHSFENILEPYFHNLPFNIAEENLQARIRGTLLMALSNKFGYILLNTSNKSELAVGYGTLYGDMCGGLSVLGDVYKTEIYELANYINEFGVKSSEFGARRDGSQRKKIIPQNSIDKPPSAELRPEQKDSDSLPEYEILDKILFQYIELKKSPQEIIKMSFDETVVKKILKLVNINEYKRHQTPPILRVSVKAFGMGRRMPIVAKYLS